MVIRAFLLALAAVLAASASFSQQHEMAVTFDDLPVVGGPYHFARQQSITRELVRSIRRNRVPVVGFVNENKLTTPRHASLLETWLDAGLELGNHTYSHRSLHNIDVAEYEADITRGEPVTRALLKKHGKSLRWFRHPFLHTGATLETKQRIESYLQKHGYRVAPVTLDNGEWIYAKAYDVAMQRDDLPLARRVVEAYVPYMERKLAYFEEQSQKLFGRNIRHVLLLHANALNAMTFDSHAAMIRKRGYRFVTLDRALEDAAYRSTDTFVRRNGISWLHRWAYTQGKTRDFFAGEPTVDQWVLDAAGVESE